MKYQRTLDLKALLARKSAFLFGPRSSGKTMLYQSSLEPDRVYDLLNAQTLKRLSLRPSLIHEEVASNGELIVIDEVQKIPGLLDEVHRTIESRKARFLLTGSSARKIKRTQSNLLGGRATQADLFSLTRKEITDFDLLRYLNHGGIPRHYLTPDDALQNELDDYTALYLKQEILDEALTRNLDGFARFLEVMAIHSGDELAIEGFAGDCGVKAPTFRNYIEILKDTLIGFEVTPFLLTKKRKAITRSKFYLFDVGVAGFLAGRGTLRPRSELFGKAFEHFIAMELRAFLSYLRVREPLSYWRSTSQFEVDFVVGTKLAIEVKATELVQDRMLKGLRALAEEKIVSRRIVVSLDSAPRKVDGIEILPWQLFLDRLWSRDLI